MLKKNLSFVCSIDLEQSHGEKTLFHLFLSHKLAALLKQLFHVSSVHNCPVLAGKYYLLKYHFLSPISLLALVHFSATPLHLLTRCFLWEMIYRAADCLVCCLLWVFLCFSCLGYFLSGCPTVVLERSIQTFWG